MSCGICLSKLKDPVSIPCGHVYCTECLTGHVSATSLDGFTSTCPTCRETFNMGKPPKLTAPQLTCLPKKFHQYMVPSIRRVYLDTSRHDGLRKKLAASEARVRCSRTTRTPHGRVRAPHRRSAGPQPRRDGRAPAGEGRRGGARGDARECGGGC
ncbi:hypothetical protein B0H10DRAFT_2364106 [Mycena sp. CBHHK59/15]|nr:hypothetical protein B0H10DRAFT_2364106 [Mycena sp. CBHHK59/15]